MAVEAVAVCGSCPSSQWGLVGLGLGKKRNKQEIKSFKREGKGRDCYPPEVCLDILVVGDEGYLVVPFVCLFLVWLLLFFTLFH